MIWKPQAEFDTLPGVLASSVGYTGGSNPAPTYQSVCRRDGHTEALRLEYDPNVITYEQIMHRVLSSASAPRGGKNQYMHAVWPQDSEQAKAAKRVAAELNKEGVPVLAKTQWHDAEEYHQSTLRSRGPPVAHDGLDRTGCCPPPPDSHRIVRAL